MVASSVHGSPENSQPYFGTKSEDDDAGSDTISRSQTGSNISQLPQISAYASADQLYQDMLSLYQQKRYWGPRRLWKNFVDYIYPDFIFDHLDVESIKMVFRNWIQIVVLLIVMTAIKSGSWIGNSAYLLNVGSVTEASGGISIAHSLLMAICNFSAVLFVVLHAAVVNAIIWQIRGRPSKEQIYQLLYDQGACPVGDSSCASTLIAWGHFLETKSTVVHVFGMLICLTLGGYISVRYNVFMLSWIFLIIACALALMPIVTLPYFDPWSTSRQIIICIGISSAARVLFCAIFFPITSNTKYLNSTRRMFGSTLKLVHKMIDTQLVERPSCENYEETMHAFFPEVDKTLSVEQVKLIDKELSRIEISYSRFDTRDLSDLRARIFKVTNTFQGFHFFHSEIRTRKGEIRRKYAQLQRYETRHHGSTFTKISSRMKKGAAWGRWYEEVGRFEKELKSTYYEHERKHFNADELTLEVLDNIYRLIMECQGPLLRQGMQTLDSVLEWIEGVQSWNFWTLFSNKKATEARALRANCLESLDRSLKALNELMQQNLSADPNQLLALHPQISAQIVSYFIEQHSYFSFVSHLFTKRIAKLGWFCQELDARHDGPRWITPFTNKGFSMNFMHTAEASIETVNGMEKAATDADMRKVMVEARDPDSSPALSRTQWLCRLFIGVYHFLMSPDIIFCVKRAGIVLAAVSLGYFRHTARLFFGHRIAWVAILAGLSVTKNSADGIYGFGVRLLWTFYGAVISVVCWYIVAQNGPGNGYGFVILFSAVYLYFSFHRLFAFHVVPIANIIFGLTLIIIPGASWLAAHQDVPSALLKPGWNTAWVRFTCVTAGLTLALLGTMFPRPVTAKILLRSVVGKNLTRLAGMQSKLVNFGIQRFKHPDVRARDKKDEMDLMVQSMFIDLRMAESLKFMIRYEPTFTGLWPEEQYVLLVRLEKELVHLNWLIYSLLDEITHTEMIPGFLEKIGWTNPELTQGIYSLLFMSSNSLERGEPLPIISPGFLEVQHSKLLKTTSTLELVAGKIRGGGSELDMQIFHVPLVIARLYYERLDGVMMLVKSLVGERFGSTLDAYDFEAYVSEKSSVHSVLTKEKPE